MKLLKPKYIKGAGYIGLLLCSLFSVMLVALLEFSNRVSFKDVLLFVANEPRILALNTILIVSLTGLIYTFVKKVSISCIATLALATIVGLVNMGKIKYQGIPFLPWDIFLFQDAARVMPAMKNELLDNKSMTFLAIAALLLIIAIGFYVFWDKKINLKVHRNKIAELISSVLLIVVFSGVLIGFSAENQYRADFFRTNAITNYFWDQNQNYASNGFLLGFTINISNIIIKKPEGYSKNKIDSIEKELKAFEIQGEEKPDIVVIMSESFADVTKIKGLEFSSDPMPRFREIGSKGLTGEVYVPVLGGKTANTEFEFLTGYSVKHLPEGSVPYQQHIKKEINSLPRYLKESDYLTTAIHNNIPEFWNREKVYQYMGFDRFISIDEFKDPFYFGSWISDADMTDKIVETLEENEDKNQFIFAVTVQNHAPYYVPGGAEEIKVEGDLTVDDKEMLSRYATGVKISDNDLYDLYSYIEKRDKPTILCFFGDHMPGGFSMYRTYPYFTNMKAGTSRKDMFATPYILWSNYKQEPKVKNVGINSLSGMLLNYADMNVPGYYGYISSEYEDQANSEYVYFDMKSTDEKIKKLRDYEFQIMYDDMFGKKYANEN